MLMVLGALSMLSFTGKETNPNLPKQKKDVYVLVHSAWLGAWQWDQTKAVIEEAGNTVIAPDLAGHGADTTACSEITMDTYIKTLTDILDAAEKPVILVAHSFNGITASRAAELRPEKVKAIVYVTAFLLPEGESFMSAVQNVEGSKAVENFMLSDDQTYALVEEKEMHNAFAHDIPEENFNAAKPYIVPEPAAPLFYQLEVSEKRFGKIPKFYIECTEDRAIPIAVQRSMYKDKVKAVFTLNSSHTPNFSQPEKLARFILEAGLQLK